MITVDVCIGSACHLKGSYGVIHALQDLIEAHGVEEQVELNAVFCLGHCTNAVSVRINEDEICSVQPDTASAFFENKILPLLSQG